MGHEGLSPRVGDVVSCRTYLRQLAHRVQAIV